MGGVVHILITCLDGVFNPASLLVLRTIRKGFPTAQVHVHGNNLRQSLPPTVKYYADACGVVGNYHYYNETITHGEWIERLLALENEPFWICDADVIFYDKIEDWSFTGPMFAGRYEPEYVDPWSQVVHVARLHPSLMWFDPAALRIAMRNWPANFPEFLNTTELSLVKWHIIPRHRDRPLFYDTCAGLHQAFGGFRFTEDMNQACAHLFAGSYSHLMAPAVDLREVHSAVIQQPELGRKLWDGQQKWYAEHAVQPK